MVHVELPKSPVGDEEQPVWVGDVQMLLSDATKGPVTVFSGAGTAKYIWD